MKRVLIVFMALLLLTAGYAHAGEDPEAAKIRYLISTVEALEGATFLRNGAEHDARAAADHLRLKLRSAGGRVKTAEDFIRLCATRSSISGEPYRIRMVDGTLLETAVFLRKALQTFPTKKP